MPQPSHSFALALAALTAALGCSTATQYIPEPKPDVASEAPATPDVVDRDVPTFPDLTQPEAALPDGSTEASADDREPPTDLTPADVTPPDGNPPSDIAPPPDTAPPLDAPCRTRCAGFCTDPDTDPENCGACGNDCTLRPGVDISRVRCVSGRCDFSGACLPGRANCSGNPDDGCEATVNTATRCGACTNVCRDPTPTCAAMASAPGGFACSSGCPLMGQQRCSGTCIDVQSDPRNCGSCGTVCPAVGGAAASCVMGRCSFTCPAGTGDCDGNPTNGCETSVRSNLTHCGMCGNTCSAPAGSTPVCSLGVCTLTCTAGNGNCDMNTANGCETDLRTSAMNCGACGNACPSGPSGTSTCVGGTCAVMCNPGFGNCNGAVSDGCEVDTNTSPLHCGVCGRRCATAANASPACAGGACTIACLANFGNCDSNGLNGCETPLASDPVNCGACGNVCPSAPGAAAACRAGMCALACMTGQGDCDGSLSNGCETNLTSSTTHCGACGRPCTAPTNGRVACEASVCVVTCDSGFMLSGTACVRAPPRPVVPAGGSFVTSRRPTFVVALVPGVTGARIEVCGDRACTMVASTFDATGSRATIPATLPPGVYFWRVAGTSGGAMVTTYSTVSEFAVVAGTTATTSATWGPFLDANGDRYADLLVSLPALNRVQYWNNLGGGFSTFSFTTITGPAFFGSAVAAAGDVNGDGYGDAIIGASSANQVFVYNGGPSGLTATIASTLDAPAGTIGFGESVSSAGDVNGDGYADLLVGAPGSNRAFLYLGRAVGVNVTAPTILAPVGGGAGTRFGIAVAGLGDINADGYADIAIGTDASPGVPNVVYAYYGSASGLNPSASIINGPAGSGFGRAVAGAGDVNGDGYPDMIVGAYTAGAAYIHRGGSGGLAVGPTTTITNAAGRFGFAVDGAGDVNGDGFGDVVVGAPVGEAAFVYNGSSAGVSPVVGTSFPRSYAGYQFGAAVSGFGDFNLDGLSDVVVGYVGRAIQIFRGNATGPMLNNTFTGSTSFGQSIAQLRRRPRG